MYRHKHTHLSHSKLAFGNIEPMGLVLSRPLEIPQIMSVWVHNLNHDMQKKKPLNIKIIVCCQLIFY